MTEPPVRWLAVMGTLPPSKLGCAEAGIVTARWSFGGESVSVRSGRQEAINESMLGPPESSYVSIATASETSQRSCRARHHEGSPPNHCFCGWNPSEAHDAAVRSGVRDSDGGRNPDTAQLRSEERRVGKECRSRWSP